MERRLTHIGRHNVTPLEVEQVLYDQPRLAVPGRDDTTEVLGQTGSGRLLVGGRDRSERR